MHMLLLDDLFCELPKQLARGSGSITSSAGACAATPSPCMNLLALSGHAHASDATGGRRQRPNPCLACSLRSGVGLRGRVTSLLAAVRVLVQLVRVRGVRIGRGGGGGLECE
eukprot:scaffold56054_cov61-Phaeocystis_antarctica.AAC.6